MDAIHFVISTNVKPRMRPQALSFHVQNSLLFIQYSVIAPLNIKHEVTPRVFSVTNFLALSKIKATLAANESEEKRFNIKSNDPNS